MRSLGCLMVLAACGQDGGVVIKVAPGDLSIDQVRLYVGAGEPTEGVVLAPPSAILAPPKTLTNVTYWSRDVQNELDVQTVAAGEAARFVLVRTDAGALPALIAVGYAGDQIVGTATAFGLPLPTDYFGVYELTLEAATPFRTTSTLQADGWSEAATTSVRDASCVGVLDPRTGDPNAHAFIVPEGDQDCDGLPTGSPTECEPDAYLGSRRASRDELSCLTSPTPSTCMLGGPICIDGQPNTPGSCDPSNYCAPVSLCVSCATLDCARDITLKSPRPAAVTCPVRVLTNGDVCEDPLLLPTQPTAGLGCTAIAIADAQQGFGPRLDTSIPRIDSQLDPGCAISFTPRGTTSTALADHGALLTVDLSNGRGLAVPIVFQFTVAGSTCTNQPVHCTADGNLAAADLLACASRWSTPTQVTELMMSSGADDPSLTEDMLEIYFHAGDSQIWSARRTSITAMWSAPVRHTELELTGGSTTPEISADGLTILFAGSLASGGTTDVYLASRSSRASPWQLPVQVTELATAANDSGAATDRMQRHLVYANDETGLGAADLFETSRTAMLGPWLLPVVSLTALNSARDEGSPFLSADGLTIFFHSNRGSGSGFDLYTAHRTDLATAFSAPIRLQDVGGTANDMDPWVSINGRTMYFASDRNGTMQIYESHR